MLINLKALIGNLDYYDEIDLDDHNWFNGMFQTEDISAIIELEEGLTLINTKGAEYIVQMTYGQLLNIISQSVAFSPLIGNKN